MNLSFADIAYFRLEIMNMNRANSCLQQKSPFCIYNSKFFDNLEDFIFEVHASIALKWYIYLFMSLEKFIIEIVLSVAQVFLPTFFPF